MYKIVEMNVNALMAMSTMKVTATILALKANKSRNLLTQVTYTNLLHRSQEAEGISSERREQSSSR